MEANITKKKRILAILITARSKNKWLKRTDLLKIASRGYLGHLLLNLTDDGLIERKGIRRHYLYRATEKASTSFLKEGTLPRSPLSRKKASERPRGHVVQLKPITQFLDVEASWMEHQKVHVRVDTYTADVVRNHCEPASKSDRAQQRSFSNASFTVTISKHNHVSLVMKEPRWQESLAKWLVACGLSQSGTKSVLSMIRAQMPESLKRMEMPVLDPTLKAREVDFAITTRVGDDTIVSNINYSTNIDFEVFGQSFLIDQWLAVLGGTQHNMVVVMSAMEQKIADLSKKVNELQKERESKDKKKKDDTPGGSMYV